MLKGKLPSLKDKILGTVETKINEPKVETKNLKKKKVKN